jgi:hypothetical protein
MLRATKVTQVREMMRAMEGDHPGLGNAVRIESLSPLGFALRHSLFQSATGQAPPLFSILGMRGTPDSFGEAQVTPRPTWLVQLCSRPDSSLLRVRFTGE